MTFRLGLTGSIGMGKSTTARLFAEEGCAVWDADAAVHRAYAKGGAAVAPIGARFAAAILDGAVSRDALRKLVATDPRLLGEIEEIVHPLVARDRETFAKTAEAEIVVFDIPLLFETGGHTSMDAVAVVTVDPEIQRRRVLARGTMTEAQFRQILDKQMPNEEKVRLADYVIETDTIDHARQQVRATIADIRERMQHA